MKKRDLAIKLRAASETIFYDLIACFIIPIDKSTMPFQKYIDDLWKVLHSLPELYSGDQIDSKFVYFHLSDPYISRVKAIMSAQCYDMLGVNYETALLENKVKNYTVITAYIRQYLNWMSKKLIDSGAIAMTEMFDMVYSIRQIDSDKDTL